MNIKTSKGKIESAFSLIDLLIAMFISSILLVGTFKAFMTSVETTTGAVDLYKLDQSTRNVIETIYNDLADLNGNTINGTPNIFPLFRDDGSIKGFVLIKNEKRLPIFNLYDLTFSPPASTTPVSVKLKSALSTINYNYIKTGQFAMLYNFRNYSWIPYKITDKSLEGNYPVLQVQKLPGTGVNWAPYLISEACVSFKAIPSTASQEQVCNSNGQYQQSNTVFIIGDIVEYELSENKLLRTYNADYLNRSVIASNITTFTPTFKIKKNVIFPDQTRPIIINKNSIRTIIHNLDPVSDSDLIDDCINYIGYRCKSQDFILKTYTMLQTIYPLVSTLIEGVQIQFKVTNESQKSSSLQIYIALDQNHGNASMAAFNPMRIRAYKDTSTTRQYGSLIANPSMYHDPAGGSTSAPFYTAVAPMISAVSENVDSPNDTKLINLCTNCPGGPGNCPGNYPALCNQDKDSNSVKDYLQCPGATSVTRISLGCISPQGSLNDRGLTALNNKIDPRMVFLNNSSVIQWNYTYDMRIPSECGGYGLCVFSGAYYNFFPSTLVDTPFPMTVFPYYKTTGELYKFYIGVARLRVPEQTETQNYRPKYNSTVFAVYPQYGAVQWLYDEEAGYTSMITDSESNPADDIASVSALQIRNESSSEYMYLSSHETNKVMYRKRPLGEPNNDLAWTTIAKAFEDNEALFPMKYTWWYREKDSTDPRILLDKIAPYPPLALDNYDTLPPQLEKRRISALLAHNDGRIYYCTPQMTPDEMINGSSAPSAGWFFTRTVTYKRPIINPSDGKRYTCDPTKTYAQDPINSYENPKCTIAAYQDKPIDWAICAKPENKDLCYKAGDGSGNLHAADFPFATDILPSYDGKLKVAFKNGDSSWQIKTIANLHDTCNGIAQDPLSGDLVISSATNILKVSYNQLNAALAQGQTLQNIDLGFKRSDKFYTANNILDESMGLGPIPQNYELRRLAGVNSYPQSERLDLVFSDMVNRIVGYAIQGRNPFEKQLFSQIVYKDLKDRNIDDVAVYTKGLVDKEESVGSWVMPFKSTKAWADNITAGTVNVGSQTGTMPIAAPIPLRPPSWVTDYSSNGGVHQRNLSNNPSTCYADPNDPKVCPGGVCTCGQDKYYRSCDGDVLAQVSIGLMGRQEGNEGCGVGSPASFALNDPTINTVPLAGGGHEDQFTQAPEGGY